jgi:hypothetical protein
VGLGQVHDAGDALAGIGVVFAGSGHGDASGRRDLPRGMLRGGRSFTGVPGFLAIDSLAIDVE